MENLKLVSYDDLKKLLSTYMKREDINIVESYYNEAQEIYKGMKRETGEDYIYHSIAVAYILTDLKMDPVTIGCALIHEAITLGKRTYEEIENSFGEESAVILSCITKISNLRRTFKKENNTERYRRIIVGLAENPKALFIKFADRLHNMRTIYVHDDAHQKEIIDETVNILIPIAHRLGVKKIMSELEDLCLKSSYPKEYNEILDKINVSRDELERDLNLMKESIVNILDEHNIKFEILSRVKSVRGIYNKLHAGKSWGDIYDLLGLRILVKKTEECYLVIGLIHSAYRSIPKRFKDFIANPKSNMYQSLHTTVFGINNRMYEVQVRTYEMDEIAEKGVASHWSYKEKIDGKVKTNLETRLENFRTLIESKDMDNNTDFFKNINSELKSKEIYVFTPKGDIIELPLGATPIDFAYRIHSEVGNTTVGALVNKKMVKLDYKLEDGDIVELNTKKGAVPNKNWLKFVKTEQAKGRIKSYFYKKEKEKMTTLGKEMLESEIKKQKLDLNLVLNEECIKKLLIDLKLDNIEDLYFNIATLKYLPSTIIKKLLPKKEEKKQEFHEESKDYSKTNSVLVEGSSDILTMMASCCNPIFGEDIVGYVTKGYGIKIHRKDCPNANTNSERIVNVEWNNQNERKYKAVLNIYLKEYKENIMDIVTIATKNEINVEALNLKYKNNEQYYEISCKVKNIEVLDKFINDLNGLKYISIVERVNTL